MKTLSYLTVLLLGISSYSYANEISPEELERWFNSDSMEPPRYSDVNDGHLVFLNERPDTGKALHHHHNDVTILPDSLRDGWILIKQCHTNIDKVPAAQVVFKKERVRDIQIVYSRNIERTWVEGASVQMENIGKDARLCIQARTHSLIQKPDGSYSLRNGPFMRRFLDGYFPLHVSLDLNYAQTNLELTDYAPPSQAGFKVQTGKGKVHVETIFEGRLQTEFHFKNKSL